MNQIGYISKNGYIYYGWRSKVIINGHEKIIYYFTTSPNQPKYNRYGEEINKLRIIPTGYKITEETGGVKIERI